MASFTWTRPRGVAHAPSGQAATRFPTPVWLGQRTTTRSGTFTLA